MHRKNQTGFSHLLPLLIIVVIVIIGLVGWRVIQHNKSLKNPDPTQATNKNADKKQSAQAAATLKDYRNPDYAFSFKYPSDWQLKEDLKDIGRGNPEGNISVTSPSGTIVTFNANLGGKGGDCWDDDANARTARTCTTIETLSLAPFPSGMPTRTLYYYQAKVTPPSRDGGAPYYSIGIVDNKYGTPTIGSQLTPFEVNVISLGNGGSNEGYVNISVKGKDDSARQSSSFFDSTEVKEASAVLKSLQL
jgi:hypothetical protein